MAGERATSSIAVDYDPNDDDQNIDSLIQGSRWDTSTSNVITYSFVDSADDIGYTLSFGWNFSSGFDANQQSHVRLALDNFAEIADVVFDEEGDDPGESNADGTIRYFEASGVSTAYAYFPSGSERGGDTYYNTSQFNNPSVGSYAYLTFLHETGHALGLEHAHEGGFAGEIDDAFDSLEFTVMTYNSFVGQEGTPAFYTNQNGHFSQTLMMYDIAALQRLYGANFETNSGDSVYQFDTATGNMTINGVSATSGSSNIIFRTVWDGNGEDTYDFSNFSNALNVDLAPGGWSDLDVGGTDLRALLNRGWDESGSFVGAEAHQYARAHVYNALQHEGDIRSLIENANGGSANDTISGNQANNILNGNGGNDSLYGLEGEDSLFGGNGNDRLEGGSDRDWLHGDDGNDTLIGGDGNDILRGASGEDSIYGGAGNDRLIGGSLKDVLQGGIGNDKLAGAGGRDILNGGNGADRLIGGSENDFLTGGVGNDIFCFRDGDGIDTITDFGNGDDMIHLLDLTDMDSVEISQNGEDTLVTWDGGGAILENYSGSLDATDFLFG